MIQDTRRKSLEIIQKHPKLLGWNQPATFEALASAVRGVPGARCALPTEAGDELLQCINDFRCALRSKGLITVEKARKGRKRQGIWSKKDRKKPSIFQLNTIEYDGHLLV